MRVNVKSIESTSIDNVVVERLLNLYPEEKLSERKVFAKAFESQEIEISDLIEECEKILLPWQMFFLNSEKLDLVMRHIEDQRAHKISPKLLAKRKGEGDTTSKRIIDRLIRQQNFLVENGSFEVNYFLGNLQRKTVTNAARLIKDYFNIDQNFYWSDLNKEKTLEYLIDKVLEKNINVCRGVLTNKILPSHLVVKNDLYKNTSGFVIKDNHVPFIFLPSEINDGEVAGRQIYTLIYLLVVIGLNQFDYFLENKFRVTLLRSKKIESRIHEIASQFLVPNEELKEYKNKKVTLDIRDELSKKFKVTPTSICTLLKLRGFINTSEYQELLPEYQQKTTIQTFARSPKIRTSLKKFCGKLVYEQICYEIRSKKLKNTQAQYLLFGVIDKKRFHKFRSQIDA